MSSNAAEIPAAAPAPRPPGLLQLAGEVLFAPVRACDSIARRRRSAFLPLLLLIIGFAVLWGYYYYHVDFPWLIERMIDGFLSRNGNASRQDMEAGFKTMTPGLMLAVTLVSGGLSILIIIALRGLYLSLIARLVSRQSPTLASWMALSIWAALPTLVAIVMSLFYIASHDVAHLMPSDVAVSSLNNLFFRLPDSHAWAAMSNSFDLLLLWNFFIMGVGFSRWTGVSALSGQLIAIAPFALLYGIWALFIVF